MNFQFIAFTLPTVIIVVMTLDSTWANSVKRSVDQNLADEKCFSSKANISTQSTFQEILSTLKSLTAYGRNKYTMTNTSFIYREVYDIMTYQEVWFQTPAIFRAALVESLSTTREESLRLALESLLFLIVSTDYPDDNVRSIPGVINLLIKDRVYRQRTVCSKVLGELMNCVTSEGGLPRRLEAEYSAYFVVLTNYNDNLEYFHNNYGQ